MNIDIDDKLMAQAQKLTGISDKNIIIGKALQLFIAVESQKKLISLRGKVKIDDEAYK